MDGTMCHNVVISLSQARHVVSRGPGTIGKQLKQPVFPEEDEKSRRGSPDDGIIT